MSSYFDSMSRRVAEARDKFPQDHEFLAAIILIEADLFDDVVKITGDREFPDDLRENMLGVLAVKGVYQPGNLIPSTTAIVRVLRSRDSRAVDDLHDLFHSLARRRIETRFGFLFDDPVGMAKLRDEHDAEGSKCSGAEGPFGCGSEGKG